MRKLRIFDTLCTFIRMSVQVCYVDMLVNFTRPTCLFICAFMHIDDHRISDQLPLFFFLQSTQSLLTLYGCIKPSRVSSLPLHLGYMCQVDLESAWAGTLGPWASFPFTFVSVPIMPLPPALPRLISRPSAAKATLPNHVPTSSCAVQHNGTVPTLPGNLPVWVGKCVHYVTYYQNAVLGEVPKCRGVRYAVMLPVYFETGVCICLYCCQGKKTIQGE